MESAVHAKDAELEAAREERDAAVGKLEREREVRSLSLMAGMRPEPAWGWQDKLLEAEKAFDRISSDGVLTEEVRPPPPK